ncbi:MAG TPA: antibiotic biosynthesis monooxygenase family protein [Candidatus Binatia bacterium]
MAVKILIQRKVRPGRENEFGEALRKLRSKAIHAQGYISGETLHSVEEPSLHLVISTWKSLEDWNRWANSPERKAFGENTDAMLQEPAKVTPYQYESNLPNVDAILSSLEFSIQDE